MSEICCAACGIVFRVPDVWEKSRRNERSRFYCPNGHSLSFQAGELDRVRRERDQLKQQIAELEDAKRAAYAENEKLLKEKQRREKRLKAGTCPCCKRTFKQLSAHMANKHPDFGGAKH